jgi:hypothetical protein
LFIRGPLAVPCAGPVARPRLRSSTPAPLRARESPQRERHSAPRVHDVDRRLPRGSRLSFSVAQSGCGGAVGAGTGATLS